MKNKHRLKLAIAQHLSGVYTDDYDFLCERIGDEQYRLILKCPIEAMIEGVSFMWKNRTFDEGLEALKEVVENSLQSNGIELTFVDADWHNLKKIQIEKTDYRGNIYYDEKLTTNKTYMGEFFEL